MLELRYIRYLYVTYVTILPYLRMLELIGLGAQLVLRHREVVALHIDKAIS